MDVHAVMAGSARVSPWDAWLRRLRHDLVKRLLWPARDRRDIGGPVCAGELVVALVDDEGNPTTAEAMWLALREGAPDPDHPAVVAFAHAVLDAVSAARQNELATVLALESAFDRLAAAVAHDG
jgi:hypothetical protein